MMLFRLFQCHSVFSKIGLKNSQQMLWMRSLFLWVLVLLFSLVGIGEAQTPSHLRWKVIETEHFNIFYHRGEERAAALASEIAEKIYGPITSLYQFRPEGKVHVVLKDYQDYSNGAAYYYDNKIEIWVTAMDFELRGTHDWLWDVITHEFTHIVSLQVARKGPRWMPGFYFQWFDYEAEKREDVLTGYPNRIVSYPLPGTIVPMWFAEGTAQYQADGARFDHWDSHRDMLLRVATLEKKLLTYHQMGGFAKTTLGNEMVYNQGYSLVRFIAEHYGKDKLRDLMAQMSRWHRFNFAGATKRVLGLSGEGLYRQWKDLLQEKYARQAVSIRTNLIEGERLSRGGYSNLYPVWSPDGKQLAYISNQGQDFLITNLHLFCLEEKADELAAAGAVSSPSWASQGQGLVFARKSKPNQYGASYWDLYAYDIEEKRETRLTHGLRARFPNLSPDGNWICFVQNEKGTNNLGLCRSDGTGVRYLTQFDDGTQIYTPCWSPEGREIAFAISRGEEREIAVVNKDGTDFHYVVSSEGSDRDPCWTPDGKGIVFSSDVTGIFNLYRISVENGEVRQLTNVIGGAFCPSVSPVDGQIVFSSYGPDGYQLHLLSQAASGWRVDSTLFQQPSNRPTQKNSNIDLVSRPYQNVYPGFSLMPRIALDEGKLKLGAYATSSDVLDRQSVIAGLLVGRNRDLDLVTVLEYRRFLPTFFLEYYKQMRHIPENQIDPDNIYKITQTNFDLNELDLGIRYRFQNNHRFSLALIYSLYNTEIKGNFVGTPNRFSFSYTYFKGLDVAFTYSYQGLRRLRDQQINPQGRQIELRYDQMFNHLIIGFKPSAIVQEVYERFYYNRLSVDWREYIALPWNRNTLGLRMRAGLILSEKKVDDFFAFHLGGIDQMRGYTYWSLEGQKVLMGSLVYRFPILGDIRRSFFPLYFDKLYGAVFADVGRAWDSDRINFKTTGFKRDVGAELRLDLLSWYAFPTCVGISAAYGLDEVEGKDPLKFYLTVLFGYN
jgi:Tol biopolymer transport system component